MTESSDKENVRKRKKKSDSLDNIRLLSSSDDEADESELPPLSNDPPYDPRLRTVFVLTCIR